MVYKLKKRFRLPEYDYSSDGYYYVTICTNKRQCVLGDVVEEKIHLSVVGGIVKQFWLEIPDHFKNAKLDEWVIMPNHIHGIIVIQHDAIKFVGTGHCPVPTGSKFGHVRRQSLSIIIGSFKSAVSKRCNQTGFSDFAWQTRFYDHIIRNEKSLQEIRRYIRNNPQKWHLDRNNPINLQKPLTKAAQLVD